MIDAYDLATIAARLALLAPHPEEERARPSAAVAAILRSTHRVDGQAAQPAGHGRGGTEVLLMRRAERHGDPWSGHMAFPGGRRDPTDPSLLATAIRETREEVGLDLEAHARLLGRLPDLPAVARSKRIDLTIAVFVFAVVTDPLPSLVTNDEVAEVLWHPVEPLARGEHQETFPYEHDGVPLMLPGLRVGPHLVWGLTYQMLQSFFAAL